MKKQAFTMVEIIISLGIMTIAMFTLVGLMPAGIQNSQETESSVRAPIIADQIGNLLNVIINGDDYEGFDGDWNDASPQDGVVDGGGDTIDSWTEWHDKFPENRVNDSTETDDSQAAIQIDSLTNVSAAFKTNAMKDPFYENLYLYDDGGEIWGGRYDVTFESNGVEVVESQYAIRIYFGSFEVDTTSGDATQASGSAELTDPGALLAIEVTWPVQMEYQKRLALGNVYTYTKYVDRH